ncbi:tetratricopeptide repeat protein [Epilithonimonas zeae]|uniref:tetratricopeptide repeat protein n=1 Tax=Epilithonimonas zeae TaxID=1416779 RepID=UPI00200ECEAF|nr:tetratricopeptide repeat protein [Epilithonimonas zeae]UQB68139.1 tetratricopeptide repeat protein [Epilithonimonas zeae]
MKFLFLFVSMFTVLQSDVSKEHCDQLIAKGIDALYQKKYSASLELLSEAKTLSEQNNWHEQQFISTNCIGLNYYQMLDYSEALDYYLEAYTIALKHLNSDREMTVLNNIAVVYLKQGKYKESEKHQKRAYDLAIANKDSIGIALYAGNLADLYNVTKQLDKALYYISVARPVAKDDIKRKRALDIAEARNYLERKDYQKALSLASPLIDKLDPIEENDEKIATLLILSKIYEQQNQPKIAIDYIKQAQTENLSYTNLTDIYNRFSDNYFTSGDYQKALLYKDSILTVKDSLNAIQNQAMYQNSEIKLKLQDSQKELDNEKKLKFYILGFWIAVLALLVWVFRAYIIKNKQKRLLAESNEQIIALELKNKENYTLLLENQIKEKETNTLLEKEKLKNELENKNRQLAANAIHLAQRNDKIEEYILRMKERPEILKSSLLTKQLDQLKIILTKEDSTDDFLTHFQEINSRFINSLKEKHNDLTLNDIRYISYIYMNLSTKEIASIFNITIEACRKRKERISKRMNLSNSNDLYNYISSI